MMEVASDNPAQIREFLQRKGYPADKSYQFALYLRSWLAKMLGVKWRSLGHDSAIWAHFDSGDIAEIQQALAWVEELEAEGGDND